MKFKPINPKILRSCLSNLLMNNYKKTYEEFTKFVKLKITKDEFEDFKKRKITSPEIKKIISRNNDSNKDEINRIRKIWNEKEDQIISKINEIIDLNISADEITCYVDPYQSGGYYGESNITVGTFENPEDVLFVISHELIHIFYWRKIIQLKLTKSRPGKETKREWELSEITDHLITTEPQLREFWNNIEIEIYPELKDFCPEMKKLWDENSFEDYLRKAYKLL
jgi:hypothetical protein